MTQFKTTFTVDLQFSYFQADYSDTDKNNSGKRTPILPAFT